MNLYRVVCIRPREYAKRTHVAATYVVQAPTADNAVDRVQAADRAKCIAYTVGLTEPQEAFLRGHFARVQYRSQSELGLAPPPRISMSSDTFTMAIGALRGSENTVYRTLVRDGFLRNVGAYDFALTIKGRITVARLILPDARANFIELAKLANQEIA